MARRHDPAGAPHELMVPADLPNKDKRFLEDLASSLKLRASFNKIDPVSQQPAITLSFPAIAVDDDSDDGPSDEDADSDQDSDDSVAEEVANPKVTGAKSESDVAVDRVLSRYLKAKVDTASDDEADPEEDYKKRLDAQMTAWKKDYYKESSRLTTTTTSKCPSSPSATSRVFSGSCTTTTTVSLPGAGSTITTMLPRFPISRTLAR